MTYRIDTPETAQQLAASQSYLREAEHRLTTRIYAAQIATVLAFLAVLSFFGAKLAADLGPVCG